MKIKFSDKYNLILYIIFDLTLIMMISAIVYSYYKPMEVNFVKRYAYDNLSNKQSCNDVLYTTDKVLVLELMRYYERIINGQEGGVVDKYIQLPSNSEIYIFDTCRFNSSILKFTFSNKRAPVGYIFKDFVKVNPCKK